jgi:predicted nucleic acid-binding protein
MTSLAYLDASALVKLVVEESESFALHRWYVEAERIATSRVGVIETRRAARRRPHDEVRLETMIEALVVFEIDAAIDRRASSIGPSSLRTLDAIHIATALSLPDVDAFITYDDRQAEAARLVGLPVIRPA